MRFDVITIFPAMIRAGLAGGVVARAADRGVLDVEVVDLRDFTTDRHRTVDDLPYGGGPGMVMKAEPFLRAVRHVVRQRGAADAVVLTSPQGVPLTHERARRLSQLNHVVVLCGRYEAVDERVREAVVTDEVSIGDYVLSGGELPALVLVDAVGRLVPGVVGDAESVEGDSFAHGLLDHPHYTRPAELEGRRVPDVLVSGDHEAIRRWRERAALRRTLERRPDLLDRPGLALDEEQRLMLRELRDAQRPRDTRTSA